MQLRRSAGGSVLGLALLCALPPTARADGDVSAGTTVFHEPGAPLGATVVIPQVDADVELSDELAVKASWSADVVSGASVAVVDAPADDVDAISSATVTDTRHVFAGGVRVQSDRTSVTGTYRYGFENDYRSHAIDISARTELFERNTSLEITYARSFDVICDGETASEAVLKARLDSSEGCFTDDPMRSERDLSVQTFQGSWTQNWTAIFNMQATLTAQVLEGLQINPYRAVRIGNTAAQEHHPEDRARYAVGLASKVWIRPLSGVISARLRGYRDTWDILSGTAELAYEQGLSAGLHLRARGRYYAQTGAVFYSDDYVLAPRGRYFTGDRELSPMRTILLGASIAWTLPADADGRVLGFLDGFQLTLKGDLLESRFPEFHYDQVEVPNDTALIGSLVILASF
ncbi:MAG: DUF3570 domain-containing protein [Myxococcales bacterium]|jgi:hypothetical protein